MNRHLRSERLSFNGVNALTGHAHEPKVHPSTLAARVWRGRPHDPALDSEEQEDLRWWYRFRLRGPNRRPAAGIDPRSLAAAGWGVIFPEESARREELKTALKPLLEHREEEAMRGHVDPNKETKKGQKDEPIRYYRELVWRHGETKDRFFKRVGGERGPAHPKNLPYYLLLVGSPEEIPPRFQYLLDAQHAVGRLHFDDLESYHRYALSVVQAEKDAERGIFHVRPEARFFSVRNPNDRATARSESHLVRPLAEALRRKHPAWAIVKEQRSSRAALQKILNDPPALLFSAAHGAVYPCDHPEQRKRQGAIICEDWPGHGPAGPEYQFAAHDLQDTRVHGLIAFLFGCYSAGTPREDNFPTPPMRNPRRHASTAFISALAQGLLGHPGGSALAVLGHIDQTWTSTFGAGKVKGCWHVESLLDHLLEGHRIGHAMDWMNERFAEISTELTDVLDARREIFPGETVDARWLSKLWRANNDARNFVVLGDPAVRLAVRPPEQDVEAERDTARAASTSLPRILGSILKKDKKTWPRLTPAEILDRASEPDDPR